MPELMIGCKECNAFFGMPHRTGCGKQDRISTPEEADIFSGKRILEPRPETVMRVKTPPWQHQRQAFDFVVKRRAAMLAMDMGCGKSLVVVSVIASRNHQRTIILAPLSVVSVWPEEFARHADVPIDVVPLDEGSVRQKQERAQNALNRASRNGQSVVVVVNYESAWREPFASWALRAGWDCLVLDESHRIKNPSAKSSIWCARLALSVPYRLALTGTPFAHSPLDIYGQYRALDRNIYGNSFFAFRHRYAIMGGYQNKNVIGFRNLEELHRKFYSIAYRVTAADVLPLPPVVHQTRIVHLNAKASRVYRELETNLSADIESGLVTAGNALARLLRLQQVTSGYAVTEDGHEETIDDGKAKALVEVFEDLPAEEPVVVFSRFTHDLAAVRQAASQARRPYFELSGRARERDAWDTGDNRGQVLGVQIQAGGLGVSMTRARYCVYYSLGFSLADYEQSKARLHRPGQQQCVCYIHLVAANTVDEKVYQVLAERKDVVEGVLHLLRQPLQRNEP